MPSFCWGHLFQGVDYVYVTLQQEILCIQVDGIENIVVLKRNYSVE